MKTKPDSTAELREENTELRARLEEAEETLRAIRAGDVDAMVVGGQIYSLKSAETPYRRLVESINEGAATLLDDTTVLYCNRRLAGLLHTPMEEILGSPLRRFVEPADRPAFDALLAAGSGGSAFGELRLLRRGAPPVPVDFSAGVFDSEGARTVCVIVTDIGERKRAEATLRRSELELTEAQRIARIGSWWLDAATDEVRWTEELFRMLGRDPASKPPDFAEHGRLFTPESWQRLSAALRRTRETGEPYELELEMVRADGTQGWMLARGEPLRNPGGAIVGLRGTAQDITERKRAEVALEESEKSFHALAESVPQIVWATRADGWNIYFNRQWVDYTGMTLAESYGHGWNVPFHPDDQRRAMEAWREATQRGATYALEARLRRKDGVYRWWLVRGVPLLDATGKIIKWFGTCTDIDDLKQTEDELRKSEASFRLIAESLPQLLWTCKPDGPCDYLNRQWVEFTGVPEERQLGFGWLEQLHPDDRAPTVAKWNGVVASGDNFRVEFRIRRHDGEYRWFDTQAVRLRDAEGHTLKWLGSNTDIHDRRRAEEEVRQLNADLEARVATRTRELADSEERLRATLDASATGSFEVDLDSGAGRWNDVEYALLGLKPGELPAGPQTFFRFVHPEDAAALSAEWEKAMHGGTLDAEFRVVRADGQVRWLAAKGHFSCAPAAAGAPQQAVRFRGVNFDITERKLAEQAARQVREDLDRAQQVGQIGSWRLDVRRNVLTWSLENYRLFGVSPGTPLTYESFMAIVHPDDRAFVDARWKAGLAGAPYDIEHRLVVDGQVKWVREKAYLEFDKAGQLLGGFGITHDLTERKAAEIELKKLAAELQLANRELESFSYSVSHDLRAPLRAMDGFSRIALTQSKDLSPESREALQIVRDSAQQMGRLIDDLLTFSRMSRQPLHKQPVSPVALVRECLETLRQEIAGRHVEIATGELPVCEADPALLKLVWTNLLSNALKFTRPRDPARIEIGARTEAGETVYFVRDNGVGFKMAYADKLFGVFQRLHRAEDFEGTGVGLATSQRIVQRHGGRIWGVAELNRGATFSFTLEPRKIP